MQYFQELLNSYNAIKQRKFKVVIQEGSRITYDTAINSYPDAAEQIHSQSAQLFGFPSLDQAGGPPSTATEGPPNTNQVTRNESGFYQIQNAEGKVNIIWSSNGNFRQKEWRNWASALARQIIGEEDTTGEAQAEEGVLSGEEEFQQVAGMDPMGQPIPIQTTVNRILTKAANTIQRIIDVDPNFFIQEDGMTPQWAESPSHLMNRFVMHPNSVEMRLNNSFKIEDDDRGNKIRVPLSEVEKQDAVTLVNDFCTRIQRLVDHPEKYTDTDRELVHETIAITNAGIMFKDPITMPGGVVFAWSRGQQEKQSNLWNNLVNSYNKRLREAAEDEPDQSDVRAIEFIRLPSAKGGGSLNNTTGKLPEELLPILNDVIVGNSGNAVQSALAARTKFSANFATAFSFLRPFVEDTAVATESTLPGIDELQFFSDQLSVPVDESMPDAIFHTLVIKLAKMEKTGLVLRQPASVTHEGDTGAKGDRVDAREWYRDTGHVLEALSHYKFPPGLSPQALVTQEANGAVSIGTSVKTYREKTNPKTGQASVKEFNDAIEGRHEATTGEFMASITGNLNIDSRTVKQVRKINKELEDGKAAIQNAFTTIKSSKMRGKESVKMALGILKERVRGLGSFTDLIQLQNIDKLVDNDEARHKFSNLLARQYESEMIAKGCAEDPGTDKNRQWRALLAMKSCFAGCAKDETLMRVRDYGSASLFETGQNFVQYKFWTDFVNGVGNVSPKVSKGSVKVGYGEGDDFVPVIRYELTGKGRGQQRRSISNTHVDKSWIRKNSLVPDSGVPTMEGLVQNYMDSQKILLESLVGAINSKN